jgi:hypothetical protein
MQVVILRRNASRRRFEVGRMNGGNAAEEGKR